MTSNPLETRVGSWFTRAAAAGTLMVGAAFGTAAMAAPSTYDSYADIFIDATQFGDGAGLYDLTPTTTTPVEFSSTTGTGTATTSAISGVDFDPYFVTSNVTGSGEYFVGSSSGFILDGLVLTANSDLDLSGFTFDYTVVADAISAASGFAESLAEVSYTVYNSDTTQVGDSVIIETAYAFSSSGQTLVESETDASFTFDTLNLTTGQYVLLGTNVQGEVPEPGTLLLLGAGLAGIAVRRRFKVA